MVKVRGLLRGLIGGLALAAVVGRGPAVAGSVPGSPPAPPAVPAKPALPPVVGAAEVVKLTAATGFIDDVVAVDDQRVAYVVADTASKAELHVYTFATQHEQVIDLAPITLQPVELALVGARALVVGKAEDGSQLAALLELADKGAGKPAGTPVYKLGPATHITLIRRDGKPVVAIHKASAAKAGTRHDVQLVALDTGKRLATARPFELDASDTHAKLELHVNHWGDGMTRAYGIKAGQWDRKENERAPDVEATYDLIAGKLIDTKKIGDLFEQRKRFQTLADAGNRGDFVRMAWDNQTVQLWRAGKSTAVELDQPLVTYDPKSLQGAVNADGTAWLALKIDPVNFDAVARKKADPEYLDVFRVDAAGKATRASRVWARGVRHRFGVAGGRFWLLERNSGFDRGGRSLTIYQPQP